MSEKTMLKAYFDGACAPRNPGGHIGIGAYILNHSGEVIFEHSWYLPPSNLNSNNIAEYLAVESCIDFIIDNGYTNEEIVFYGDSKLVIMQMSGKWKVKNGMYVKHAINCKLKRINLINAKFVWIPREMNERADFLSNVELSKRGIKFEKP